MKEYELKNEQLEEVSGGEGCPFCGSSGIDTHYEGEH